MDNGQSIIFLAVPVIIVIIINIFFLFSVINVLRTKLIFENNFNKKNDINLKSARAVLILVPIFGVQFLLLPMRPDTGSSLEYVYEVIASITTSTQGLAVSFLLCFCNNDISSMVRKTFYSILRFANRIGCAVFPQYFDENRVSYWLGYEFTETNPFPTLVSCIQIFIQL